jgi:hypothetical protein
VARRTRSTLQSRGRQVDPPVSAERIRGLLLLPRRAWGIVVTDGSRCQLFVIGALS